MRERLRELLLGGQQRVLGNPQQLGSRILTGVIILSAMVAGAGGWYLLVEGVSPQISSYGVAAPVVQFATSVWSYVILELILLRGLLRISNSRLAHQSAAYLGMEPETVLRLSAEAKSTDGSTRVICTSDDSEEQIRERLSEGFRTSDDDTLTWSEGATEEPTSEPDNLPAVRSEVVEPPRLLSYLLPAAKVGALGAAVVAAVELAPGGHSVPVLALAAVLGLTLIISLARFARARWRARRHLRAGDGEELPFEAGLQLWRMDAAARLQSGELLWQFAAPAALAFGALVLIMGIWLQPWSYVVLLAGGVCVGAVNYARIRKQRSRELRKLRADTSAEQWEFCSVLVKGPITVGSTQMCYGWFGGDGYAAHSERELCEELAPRVHALLQGETVEPSVHRKYYRNVRDLYPDLHGWRSNVEEHQISEALIRATESAPNGIIPKAKLIEDVVLHDKDTQLMGLLETGYGYDPALVRECYQELCPYALVEEQMHVEGTDGEQHEVTAVRLRTEPLPANLSEVRAQFSNRFRAYAQFQPLFELPEVELPEHHAGGVRQ